MGNVVEEKSDLDTVAEKIATTAQNPTARIACKKLFLIVSK